MRVLPVADVVVVEVDERTEQLFHDHGGLLLRQVLLLKDKVKKFTTLTIPAHSQ